MHELESLHCITYGSWAGYYVVHSPKREVRFYKDEQGLPYLDLSQADAAGAIVLLQRKETGTKVSLVQTMRGNYEGYTKREVLKAKEGPTRTGNDGKPQQEGLQGNGEQQSGPELANNFVRYI